jgi:hypothetical protein
LLHLIFVKINFGKIEFQPSEAIVEAQNIEEGKTQVLEEMIFSR